MTPSYYKSYTFDIETGIPLFWDEVPYTGKWAQAKKGRETQQKVSDQSLALSGANAAKQNQQYGAASGDINNLDSAPGSLSPAASAQLSADLRNIGDTYNNTRAVGLQRIAQHGMGTLTGETSSLMNSADMAKARDEVAAQEQAQLNTHNDQLAALNARMSLQGLYNPNAPLQTASQSAMDQAQQGNTLGDIGKGLTTLASLGSYSVPGVPGLSVGSGG